MQTSAIMPPPHVAAGGVSRRGKIAAVVATLAVAGVIAGAVGTMPASTSSEKDSEVFVFKASLAPTSAPSMWLATSEPTATPTKNPTVWIATSAPTSAPSTAPTHTLPVIEVTDHPTKTPTGSPTAKPSELPTMAPTKWIAPTKTPTTRVTTKPPTTTPTSAPTKNPTTTPTITATTGSPTSRPTSTVVVAGSDEPTKKPTKRPTNWGETARPTLVAIEISNPPTSAPTSTPSIAPTPCAKYDYTINQGYKCSGIHIGTYDVVDTRLVCEAICSQTAWCVGFEFDESSGTITQGACSLYSSFLGITPATSEYSCNVKSVPRPCTPTSEPTKSPTKTPTTQSPTNKPSATPTKTPSKTPTAGPTKAPTAGPTKSPSAGPTMSPTAGPTKSPTAGPTKSPTAGPTKSPTAGPTISPTAGPTKSPTAGPTKSPTAGPTKSPTAGPTKSPTAGPTKSPTASPSNAPSSAPTPCAKYDYPINQGYKCVGVQVDMYDVVESRMICEAICSHNAECVGFDFDESAGTSTQGNCSFYTSVTGAEVATSTQSCNVKSAPRPCTPTSAPTAWPTKTPTAWIKTSEPTSSPTKTPTSSPSKTPTSAPSKTPTKKPTVRVTIEGGDPPSKKPTNWGETYAPSDAPTLKPTVIVTTEGGDSPSKKPTNWGQTYAPTTKPTIVAQSGPCDKLDVVFVIDESNSIDMPEFTNVVDFVKKTVTDFENSITADINYAITLFNDKVRTEVILGDSSRSTSGDDFKTFVSSITKPDSGLTCIAGGLQAAVRANFGPLNADGTVNPLDTKLRAGVPTLVFLVSDGVPNWYPKTGENTCDTGADGDCQCGTTNNSIKSASVFQTIKSADKAPYNNFVYALGVGDDVNAVFLSSIADHFVDVVGLDDAAVVAVREKIINDLKC